MPTWRKGDGIGSRTFYTVSNRIDFGNYKIASDEREAEWYWNSLDDQILFL